MRLVGASGVSPPACGPRGCLSFPCARLSAPVMRPRCGTVVLCATRCVCCVEAGDLCRTEASRSRESWRVRPLVSGPGLAQTSCQRWLRPRSSQASPHRGCAGRSLLCCCAHEIRCHALVCRRRPDLGGKQCGEAKRGAFRDIGPRASEKQGDALNHSGPSTAVKGIDRLEGQPRQVQAGRCAVW